MSWINQQSFQTSFFTNRCSTARSNKKHENSVKPQINPIKPQKTAGLGFFKKSRVFLKFWTMQLLVIWKTLAPILNFLVTELEAFQFTTYCPSNTLISYQDCSHIGPMSQIGPTLANVCRTLGQSQNSWNDQCWLANIGLWLHQCRPIYIDNAECTVANWQLG